MASLTSPRPHSVVSQAVINHNNTEAQMRRRERVMKDRNRVISYCYSAWYEIKDTQWNISFTKDVRPSTRPPCNVCVPSFGKKPGKETDHNEHSIIDVNKISRTFYGLLSSLAECLKMRSSPDNVDDHLVLQDERVIHAIQNAEISDESTVLCLLEMLKSKYSHFKYRIFIWLLSLFLKSEFRAVCVNEGQLKILKNASKRNNLVFFPLHRSSMDLPVLAYTLAKINLKFPSFANEETADCPAMRGALDGLGCISYDKWKIEDDLYRAVTGSYLSHCWGSASDVVVFPEGNISRSGKPHVGRGNLFYLYAKCYQDKSIQDAQIVPVSVSYDKTIDGYLQGKSSWSIIFRLLFRTLFIRSRGGFVRVNFGQSFSYHDIMMKFEKTSPLDAQTHMSVSSVALNEDESDIDRFSYTVHRLLRHLIYDCQRLSPVMATQAISFLLLHKGRRHSGMTMSELSSSLDDLREDLTARSADTGFIGMSDDVVLYAIELIGAGLIEKQNRSEGIFLTPSQSLPNLLELSRLANSVIIHFSMEGVVSRVLTCKISTPTMTNVMIVDSAYDLCEILQFEFVFTPSCVPLNDFIYQTFDDFVTGGILLIRGHVHNVRRVFANESDEEDMGLYDDDEPEPQSIPCAVHLEHPKLQFFSGLLKPTIEVYACTVGSLNVLYHRESMLEEELVENVLSCAHASLRKGIIKQGDCISEETVVNCLRLLEKWRVLDVAVKNGVKLYVLMNDFKDPESLQSIYDRIDKFT